MSKVRHKYSPRKAVVVDCSVEPSRTKQSFAVECDINNIIRGYDRNGLISHLNEKMPQYADLVHDNIIGGAALDYHQALTMVRQADSAFRELPAEVRQRFENDPAKFLAFVDDPANQEEMVHMGLADAREIPGLLAGDPPAEPVGGDKVVEEPDNTTADGQGT